MAYPHLLKHVEVEILLNSQPLAFHQELSLHISWKNTKTDLNIWHILDYGAVPHYWKIFIA